MRMWRVRVICRKQRRWCSGGDGEKKVQDSGAAVDFSKQVSAEKSETQVAEKKYDPRYVHSRTRNDGEVDILFKHNPPANPTAHQEGPVLDFTDSAPHEMQHNPFENIIAEAKTGDWEAVSPRSIGLPGGQQRSLYGFERNNKQELTNYGRSNDYISATPPDLDEGLQLHFAAQRLPAFDATRESLFDKYALRRYTEERDLRLLEREALLAERGLAEWHSEMQLQSARDLRKVTIKDAVMQNPYRWLPLKYWESEEAYVRQGEDTFVSSYHKMHFGVVAATVFTSVFVFYAFLADPSMKYIMMDNAGEVSCISGYVGRSELYGSYKDVGDMYRFQDAVTKHGIKLEGGTHESLAVLRRAEGHGKFTYPESVPLPENPGSF